MELASNGFAMGMMMDYEPMNVPNNVYTNALNATLITYNGNEYMLQNDMGNGRVETAYLPEGFIPVGTTSFGGIIYVASYNPLTGTSQIGSFPSPERNFGMETTDNSTDDDKKVELKDSLCTNSKGEYYTQLNIPISTKINLTPGDKFILVFNEADLANMYGYVDGILKNNLETDEITCTELSLGIMNDGKIRELLNLATHTITYNDDNYTSLFLGVSNTSESTIDIDLYRTAISSPYSILTGVTAGTLCLIIKIKVIETFSASYSVKLTLDE